jgi:hypothetical protein
LSLEVKDIVRNISDDFHHVRNAIDVTITESNNASYKSTILLVGDGGNGWGRTFGLAKIIIAGVQLSP